MWKLAPTEKLALLLITAGMVAVTSIFVACWVVSTCHDRKEKKRKGDLKGVVYGSAAKNGVNLTNFVYQATPHLQTTNGEAGGERTISEGALVGKLNAEKMDSLGTSEAGGKRSASRQDSSYHSMSSGRNSPVSVRSRDEIKSTGSISEEYGSPPESSLVRSPSLPPASPSITISLLLTHLKQDCESNNQSSAVAAKLAISVESVTDLPSREYKAHCDPWVAVSVLRDRRSLRRRPPASLAYFRTKTIRHAHNPFYSQTFVADLQKNEIKDVSVRFTVMDQDRHIGAREIGRALVSLKEAKQTIQDPERSTLTLFLGQPKRENGEIQFGLSYLPTAQRLSFSLTKATNLRFDKEDKTNTDKNLNPYVKLILFSGSGRLVKKKKSAVKWATKDPVFDETINFEAEPGQLENHTLMIILLSKPDQDDMQGVGEGVIGVDLDSSDQESYYKFNLSSLERNRSSGGGKEKDPVLGVLYLGRKVHGDRERDHWKKMMESPRKVFSVQHSLK